MSTDVVMKERRLLLNLEKSFDLLVYAKQMALMFAEFGCSKPKPRKQTYAFNVLEFIDGSASEGRETSDSSTNEDSASKSTVP